MAARGRALLAWLKTRSPQPTWERLAMWTLIFACAAPDVLGLAPGIVEGAANAAAILWTVFR